MNIVAVVHMFSYLNVQPNSFSTLAERISFIIRGRFVQILCLLRILRENRPLTYQIWEFFLKKEGFFAFNVFVWSCNKTLNTFYRSPSIFWLRRCSKFLCGVSILSERYQLFYFYRRYLHWILILSKIPFVSNFNYVHHETFFYYLWLDAIQRIYSNNNLINWNMIDIRNIRYLFYWNIIEYILKSIIET